MQIHMCVYIYIYIYRGRGTSGGSKGRFCLVTGGLAIGACFRLGYIRCMCVCSLFLFGNGGFGEWRLVCVFDWGLAIGLAFGNGGFGDRFWR